MATLLALATEQFEKGLAVLEEAVERTDIEPLFRRDACLLRFELACELAAKVTKRLLEERYGFTAPAPKTAYREARRVGVLNERDTETFLRLVDDRNRMVHDYSEEFSNQLFDRVQSEYLTVLRTLHAALEVRPDKDAAA